VVIIYPSITPARFSAGSPRGLTSKRIGELMANQITVLVAESVPLMRLGLAAALGDDPDIEVVGVVEDGLAAVEATRRLHPRVVVMGTQRQHADGIRGTRLIRTETPDVEVLVVGGSEEDSVIFSVIEAGAIGYVLRDISPDDLRDAIHRVCNGMTMVHPRVMRTMVHRLTLVSQKAGNGRARGLTCHELEVLLAMAAGRTDKEIAQQLFVSPATVKSHIRTVFQKTGTANRAQAVALAMRVGLIR
jgi:DNA-binding NarL/FixJ family response regulator